VSDADEFRTRVLDGAVRVLLDGGFASDRLHSAIAREAGLSRPTVYKYGGTLEEIRAAVIARELGGLMLEVSAVLSPVKYDARYMIDLIATAVAHTRRMPLLEAALRDIPDQVLPLLTLHASIVMNQVREVADPLFEPLVEAGNLTAEEAAITIDLLVRLALSLVLIRTGRPLEDKEQVEDYLDTVFGIITTANRRRRR
jgi:AcrR family transcriptional regulator